MGREQRTGVYDIPENPRLEDLLAASERHLRVTIRTSTIAIVAPSDNQPLGYDPGTQLCSVLTQQLTVTANPDVPQGLGSTVTQPPVLLVDIPVSWPRTRLGYLTFPLNIGDSGELIIQDRSIAEWMKKGYPVDPVDSWTHNRGDGVFHPGLHSDNDRLPSTDQAATVVEGQPVGGVKLGRSAALGNARLTDPVAPSVNMALWMSQVTAAINLLAPGSVTPVIGDIGLISGSSTKVLSE